MARGNRGRSGRRRRNGRAKRGPRLTPPPIRQAAGRTAGRRIVDRARKYRDALPLLVTAGLFAAYAAQPEAVKQEPLPLTFRMDRTDLSGLPVGISDVRSCGCWTGTRSQAQKKFKFTIANNSERTLNIADSTDSAVRLLVAYPDGFVPRVTIADVRPEDDPGDVQNPPDRSVWLASGWRAAPASKLEQAEPRFAVPADFDVWAIPATPNYTVENAPNGATHATVVDQATLYPGESYGSTDLGHGTWVFNVPLPPDFASLFHSGGEFEIVPSEKEIAEHVRVLGVAVIAGGPDGDAPAFLGFAPAPPDSALESPLSL